jgi:V8-like Glu-specific endopeptidase
MFKWISIITAAVLSSSAVAAKYKPTVVYGNDDRKDIYQEADPALRALAASTVAIISASNVTDKIAGYEITGQNYGEYYGLCEREPYFTQPNPANCSGFYLGGDLFATAGHCLNQFDCANWKFVFDYDMKDANTVNSLLPIENVYTCKEVISAVEGYPVDFAVIRVDREVINRTPVRLQTSNSQVGDQLIVIGHPSGLPTKIAGGAAVRTLQNEYFEANLDTYGGNSGSAVFNATTQEVAGILVRGEGDYTYDNTNSCYVSNTCANDGCSGESVTYISYVIDALHKLGK